MRAVLYVHGKGGSAAESEHYRPLFPGAEVLGLDYRGDAPWEAGEEIRAALEALRGRYEETVLIANSIGAFFSMCAGVGGLVKKAYFISPIVDMERLIGDMLRAAGLSEEDLEREGLIRTDSGAELSRNYLRYVRSHPLDWDPPTQILCGSGDALCTPDAVRAFAARHGAGLTVMDGGEHWFHTEEQMRFLDGWIRRCEEGECPRTEDREDLLAPVSASET